MSPDGVTIRNLLTMSSGVKWNEDYGDPNADVARSGTTYNEPGVNPIVSYMRRLPREHEPGTTFHYNTDSAIGIPSNSPFPWALPGLPAVPGTAPVWQRGNSARFMVNRFPG